MITNKHLPLISLSNDSNYSEDIGSFVPITIMRDDKKEEIEYDNAMV